MAQKGHSRASALGWCDPKGFGRDGISGIPGPYGIFPEHHEDSDVDILKMLDGQNEGIGPQRWKVLRRTKTGTAAQIIVLIGENQALRLKRTGYKLNYKFGMVR